MIKKDLFKIIDYIIKRQPIHSSFNKDKLITAKQFVPIQNNYGGFIYAIMMEFISLKILFDCDAMWN